MERRAEVTRETQETSVTVRIDLDGTGRHEISSGVPFLDHMLTQVAVHGLIDLSVAAQGDLEVDDHHTLEDVGIVLGQAIRKALGDARGLARYGSAIVPMDDALALVAVDLSGRPFLAYDVRFAREAIGRFDAQLLEEFLRALTGHAGITLHVRMLAGRNAHHMAEAMFKALGRALCQAVRVDPRRTGVPSSKGEL
ncbi:MAG: imidazoleglycerol-phosphate dehydratase HisB [Anaerolineae bacterium]|nr:imidazoleglycerol-phosphate dehydratase HisB [Anaerolineae bacterium]